MFGSVGRRCFHLSSATTQSIVRVRFAPSPTGYIHLGGLRTALYNFLFAKANGGKFILRIEDTDQKRLVPGAAKQLEDDLNWMGLTSDESPLRGGGYGPYTQSERLDLYKQYTEELVKSGHAYPCFCTNRRLDLVKKEAVRVGSIPRYDNRCRQLTQAQIEEKKRQGVAYCIRFQLAPLNDALQDIVYGDVDRTAVLTEGDPVIMKQDGFPTYHLANVVDDHLMEITHVLRGTEWLVSTPKHVLLYKAFNWKPPSFAHLPLIMNADGTKLSKRQDDIRLEHFRSQGFYPEALISLLCLVGGGFSANSDIQNNLLSINELAKSFNLGSIATHGGKLDMVRLEHFNRVALQNRFRHSNADTISEDLASIVRATLPKSSLDAEMLEKDNLVKVLKWATDEGRIHLLRQLVEPGLEFLWSCQQQPILTKIEKSTAGDLIDRIILLLKDHEEVSRNTISKAIRELATEYKVKSSDLMKLTRSALTGMKEGPSVGETIEILGPHVCIRRLKASAKLL